MKLDMLQKKEYKINSVNPLLMYKIDGFIE